MPAATYDLKGDNSVLDGRVVRAALEGFARFKDGPEAELSLNERYLRRLVKGSTKTKIEDWRPEVAIEVLACGVHGARTGETRDGPGRKLGPTRGVAGDARVRRRAGRLDRPWLEDSVGGKEAAVLRKLYTLVSTASCLQEDLVLMPLLGSI